MRRVLVILTLLALAPPMVAADDDVLVAFEAGEPGRAALDAAGQRNCIREASLATPDPSCPVEKTPIAYPSSGVLVLDDFVTGLGVKDPERTRAAIERGDPTFHNKAVGGMNTARASRGQLPDMILPGHQTFEAWFGWWNDLNGDGNIQLRQSNFEWSPGNEWAPKNNAIVASWIDPGSHPTMTNQARPDALTPDLRYFDAHTRYILPDSVVFLDGSLLQTYSVVTVADALLAPDGEGNPFTTRPASRVDLDRYAAVVPGPVELLYAQTLGPLVNAVGSPGYSTCPNACRPHPLPTSGLPEGETLAETQGRVWAPHPREWEPESGNTAAGRLEMYRERYAGWIDLLALTAYPSYSAFPRAGPLVGETRDGVHVFGPGYLTFEARVGIWKDLTEDGVVGLAAGPDPYQGGTRPMPDEYDNPAGEFVGVEGRQGEDAQYEMIFIRVTLTPDEAWGPSGIWGMRQGQPTCSPHQVPCLPTTGSTPFTLGLGRDSSTLGLYWTTVSILMPEGSVAFEACTETVLVRHDANGGERVIDEVRDCDRFAAWDPQRPMTRP
ncbi:MAG TPA: hypothetical protein VM889_00655 [Candidatus Thermoplasmatota archaeon]|nr:hypothetical protein [Candidatus Thermoplasmatota archaeon]